jgi:glutathione S-transferase
VLTLVTIPISHYCEKARWALDRAGIPYREERHVQGIHRIAARRAGGGLTVPVLVTPDGALGESADILDWVDARTPLERRLFPADAAARSEVEGLCRRFDEVLGPRGRRLMYIHMFPARSLALRYNNAGVPPWENRAIRAGWPFVRRLVSRVLDITPGVETEDLETVRGEFDFVAGLLSDGRAHLSGERFGAADLTFAALAAPLVLPAEYGVALPRPEELPAPMAGLVERAREHPAGRYALGLFAKYRQRDSNPCYRRERAAS